MRTDNENTFTALSQAELEQIERVLQHPRDATARGAFDPSSGAFVGEAPLVPIDAKAIASVTSIRRHGAEA
jgi:hypothetical protein